jgi:hypothetical protein
MDLSGPVAVLVLTVCVDKGEEGIASGVREHAVFAETVNGFDGDRGIEPTAIDIV